MSEGESLDYNCSVPLEEGERKVTALLHKYYVNEVRPVRFGPKEDASTTITLLIVAVGLIKGSLYLYSWINTGSGIAKFWKSYVQSNQFLVALLLFVWMIGYNVVSYAIWHRFERMERYPADDFYIISGAHGESPPILLTSPDHRFYIGASL